jgi:hypothetical protein
VDFKMFNWFRKKKKLPVPQEVENAAKLYYEASEGSLQRLSDDEFCGYIGAECQAFVNDGEDRTEEIFYKMVNEVVQNQYNLDVRL